MINDVRWLSVKLLDFKTSSFWDTENDPERSSFGELCSLIKDVLLEGDVSSPCDINLIQMDVFESIFFFFFCTVAVLSSQR